MAKLTLSVDDAVISQAKRFAKLRGTSISEIVETYLSAVSGEPSGQGGATPVLRSVRGVLKHADIQDYRDHLAAKYR
jgi:hypothetical protein